MTLALQRFPGSVLLPDSLRGGVVAIGNFDGIHRGHQTVLETALERAGDCGCAALALTFEPHPRSVFRPNVPLFRLTPAPMKARLLDAMGFDAVVEQPFDKRFASFSPQEFIERILVRHLGISHLVTGFDFHFGQNRGGTPEVLTEAGKEKGFGVTVVDAHSDEGGAVISSSRIRELLMEGAIAEAAGLLGYRFTVEAEVTGGQQLGRTLGFPTANMALSPETNLSHGVYAVRFRRADGRLHNGVASFGRRPTVTQEGAPLLETFLFDFDGDLYGEKCSVSLFSFLRGEEKYDGLDPLVAQMKRDEAEARAVLSAVTPISALDKALAFDGLVP